MWSHRQKNKNQLFADMMVNPFAMADDTSDNPSEEETITRFMLADARYYLNADPIVRSIFGVNGGDFGVYGGNNINGNTITVGEAYSRSYSSTTVNGKTLYRVQITFPINGISSRDTESGWGTLVGTQDGITALEIDVAGCVVNVRL
mmetsp:Transcript_24655/g.59455  ORF Transcript_24655/g.59455 Transcript_24655/m.59455 type:complete len:147 (-) Transcript_24655:152-592(-)